MENAYAREWAELVKLPLIETRYAENIHHLATLKARSVPGATVEEWAEIAHGETAIRVAYGVVAPGKTKDDPPLAVYTHDDLVARAAAQQAIAHVEHVVGELAHDRADELEELLAKTFKDHTPNTFRELSFRPEKYHRAILRAAERLGPEQEQAREKEDPT